MQMEPPRPLRGATPIWERQQEVTAYSRAVTFTPGSVTPNRSGIFILIRMLKLFFVFVNGREGAKRSRNSLRLGYNFLRPQGFRAKQSCQTTAHQALPSQSQIKNGLKPPGPYRTWCRPLSTRITGISFGSILSLASVCVLACWLRF